MLGALATEPTSVVALAVELRSEQIRALYKKALIPFGTVVVNSALVAVAVRNHVRPTIVIAWLSALWALTLARAALVWAFRRNAPTAADTGRWGWAFTIGAAVSGIIWGSAGIVLFVPDAIHLQVFLAFVLGGMAAGAATSHSSFPPAHLAFTVPALLPITITFFGQDDEIHILMAILMCLFAVAVSVIARTSAAMFQASTKHQIENRALLDIIRERSELAEARLRALLNQAALGVLVAEADGLEIVDANGTAARLVGAPNAEKLLGERLDSLHLDPGGQGEATWREAVTSVEEKQHALMEFSVGGVQLEASLSILSHQKHRYLLAVLKDVSERKSMQSELIRAEALASIGSLAAGVAHEINNPLACIAANVEVVREALLNRATTAGSSQIEALDDTLASTHQIQQTVRSLMDLDWTEAHTPGPVDLAKVLHSAARITSNQIRHRARLEVELGELPMVLGDANGLSQVFLSLLTNAAEAIEATPNTENRIGLRAEANGESVRVEVSDTGSGIAPQHLSKIFEPYFTTKPMGKGTGLGLSLCHSIVTSVGGTIRVKSRPGVGTTFTVELKIAKPRSIPAPPPLESGEGVPTRATRVLIVDDDIHVARAIRRLLRAHDLRIAGGGPEALEILQGGESFDVVLCDVMMPKLSGPELYSRVRETSPALAERFVFVTGGVMSDEARSFLEENSNQKLAKPFSREDLERVVLTVARSGSAPEAQPQGAYRE